MGERPQHGAGGNRRGAQQKFQHRAAFEANSEAAVAKDEVGGQIERNRQQETGGDRLRTDPGKQQQRYPVTQAGTGETLDKSRQLAQRGYAPQAQQFEEKARKEIESG